MNKKLCESCQEKQGKYREDHDEYLCSDCFKELQEEVNSYCDYECDECDYFREGECMKDNI